MTSCICPKCGDAHVPDETEPQLTACPFCAEDDFDPIGLKNHIERGWCEAYEAIEKIKI